MSSGSNDNAMLARFKTVTRDRLERVVNAMIRLESQPDDAEQRELLAREVHTIKGETRMMGFAEAAQLAHRVEDLLARAKHQQFRLESSLSNLIFAAFDMIGAMVLQEAPSASSIHAFMAEVDRVLADGSEPAVPSTEAIPPAKRNEPHVPAAHDTTRVHADKLDPIVDIAADVAMAQIRASHALNHVHQISERLNTSFDALIAQVSGAGGAQGAKAAAEQSAHQLRTHQRLITELQAAVSQVRGHTLEQEFAVRDLEERIRELRLLPLSTLFSRCPRLIRDLSAAEKKRVRLETTGADVEVDRQVIEAIDEPLMHLIRNAVDHGIESSVQRRAADKPEEGRVSIRALQSHSIVEITVSDDGAGLELERIRDAAVRVGLVERREAEQLDAPDALALIFRHGFSTRGAVSDLSGRGLGLDVVKRGVESLGGSVEVHSEPGHGTSFVLRVPVSAARSRVFVVACGRAHYAIPCDAAVQTAQLPVQQLERLGTSWVWKLGDDRIAVVRLASLLGAPAGAFGGEELRALIVQHHRRRVALVVDRLVGERAVVQRPLDGFVQQAQCVAGAAVLDDGELVLILRTSSLMDAMSYGMQGPSIAPVDTAELPVVLVVDDSEVTRELLSSVVRRMGLRVIEAVDGKTALAQIAQRRPNLIVTDLEMPGIDGFGLLERVRTRPDLRDIPVVVVSSRGADTDMRRALQLGADAYVVKRTFEEASFIRLLSGLVRPSEDQA